MNFKSWVNFNENTNIGEFLLENANNATRYSVEVNFRSNMDEVCAAFAKIALGYVSAAIKQNGYHVKHVYDSEPVRIIVSSRNFDDGEWTCVVSYNAKHDGGSFILSKGFYNKDRKTISVQSSKKCEGKSAAEIARELREMMLSLKDEKDRHQEKLNPVHLKRGPKR